MKEHNKPKKILFVVPALYYGGATKVYSFAMSAVSKNNIVHALTFNKSEIEYSVPNKRYNYSPNDKKPQTFLAKSILGYKRYQYIKKIIIQNDIDIVIGFLKQGGVPTVLASLKVSKVKSVVAIRNNPHAKFKNLNGKLSAFLYRFADCVVTNSRAAEQICKKEYSIRQATSIYNPVDYEEINAKMKKPIPEKYSYIFQNGNTFINIGRLSSQKGQWHSIRAFSEVVDDHPEANLVILGEGEMRENLESLIKKCGLEENVFLLGHQDNVFSYLNAADCFVLSSMHEGLPNVVLEAKAVGLPIISVDCDTGPREILAPELSYNESISYPYQTGRHVIVEPLSGDQIFENTETKPLDSAERSLASAMNKKIKKGFEENEFEYDDRFDPQRVINQWVELIK